MMCMTVAVIPRFVVRRYAALVVAKKGMPAVSNAATFNSLLASRMADWL